MFLYTSCPAHLAYKQPMGDQLYYVYCILLRFKTKKEKKKEKRKKEYTLLAFTFDFVNFSKFLK